MQHLQCRQKSRALISAATVKPAFACTQHNAREIFKETGAIAGARTFVAKRAARRDDRQPYSSGGRRTPQRRFDHETMVALDIELGQCLQIKFFVSDRGVGIAHKRYAIEHLRATRAESVNQHPIGILAFHRTGQREFDVVLTCRHD